MHYAASLHATAAGTMANYARAKSGKIEIDILLNNHADDTVYTTFDAISGRVKIRSTYNARFEDLQITLDGHTKTYVENLSPHSTTSRTTANHNFLKLSMPIRDSDYPQPRIAEAGRTYTFPFNFAIPQQLLPRACVHDCVAGHVQQAHLQLPPSLGDREGSAYDDMAPTMAQITYSIKVKVIKNKDEEGKDVVLVEKQRKLRVVPAVAEAPPLSTGEGFDDYLLAKSKMLRKSLFSSKLGRITVSSSQPKAVMLPSPRDAGACPTTTMATINLRFDPKDETSQPPRLGGLNTKIRASTFFSARSVQTFPNRYSMSTAIESTRGVYETSVPVSSRCVEGVTWEKIQPKVTSRRNSDTSVSSSDYSDHETVTERTGSTPFYTAQILVPINLPSYKRFVPTFHTCIVSRVYTLDLTLTIHTPGAGVPASSVTLRLPVQIGAVGNLAGLAQLSPAEAAAELAEANEFFRPRVIEIPREEHIGNSVLTRSADLPPSYEDFFRATIVEPSRS
ncbi:hypothetical protein B0O99DRAFT_509469 [Bisporella sp. PMI_857]|nr:hypothetical protein B0O99DRAFT_509469 [Bisporella sp. PMI_857]